MSRKPPPSRKGAIPWNKGRTDLPKKSLSRKRRDRQMLLEERALQAPLAVHPRVAIAMTNPYNVQVGQVWINVQVSRTLVSKKAGAPAVKVAKLEPPYAVCYWTDVEGNLDLKGTINVSKLRLDLFRVSESRKTRWGGGWCGWRLKE